MRTRTFYNFTQFYELTMINILPTITKFKYLIYICRKIVFFLESIPNMA